MKQKQLSVQAEQIRKDTLPSFKDQDLRQSVRLLSPQVDQPLSLEDFTVLKVLGQGTFGKVYLATASDRQYAIKILRKDKILTEKWALEKTR